ncbi:PAS domain S-box protein [Pelomonas sp. P7]|uniref:histidine kinase n=3 Tax=Roseateles TaxID=93681 RepID=A0ABS8XMM4_9BURK|nr:PAS domain S-box protein [Pelomonas sp. P7]MCE4540333.1 PAS domain S-box protein [Pelomonas sp. P7]
MPFAQDTLASPPAASEAATRRLALLLESTGEGIFGIDMDGRCTFVNRAACETLGWRTEDVLGRNMHELIHHSRETGAHYPECDCPIFNAFRRGEPCRIDDEVLWRADGSPFPAEYSSYPVIEGGAVQGAVVTFVDISARRRAEALLRASHDQLEQRVAERTAELRELAHHLEAMRETERKRIAREIHDELGSLLVALKMDLDWLARRVGDPALREPMLDKCQRMGGLVDTAVDSVGRIITDLRPSILDHQGLWAALEWQAQEFRMAGSDERQVDFKMHVAADVAPPSGGQAIAVFRIFQEVLSNIARHARAGHVAIRIDVDAPPAPVLYLQVRDDGVGAAPEALNDARSYGVLGMRERAAHFGGRIGIDSAPGRGTTVRLAMPLESA